MGDTNWRQTLALDTGEANQRSRRLPCLRNHAGRRKLASWCAYPEAQKVRSDDAALRR
jgi:hypothetical protein